MAAIITSSLATAVYLTMAFRSVAALKASDYFNVCSLKDPNLNDCVKNAINAFQPKLVAGIPELRLPPYDPIHIPRMEFKGKFALIEFNQILTNIVGVGQGAYHIDDVKFDPKALTLDMKETLPQMNSTAHYTHEGPLSYMAKEGEVNYLVRGIKKNIHIQFVIIQDQAGQYILQVKDWNWDWEIEDGEVHFTNLALGKTTGMFGSVADQLINFTKNFKLGFKMFKYLPEREFAIYFKSMVNTILMHFPLRELLPQ